MNSAGKWRKENNLGNEASSVEAHQRCIGTEKHRDLSNMLQTELVKVFIYTNWSKSSHTVIGLKFSKQRLVKSSPFRVWSKASYADSGQKLHINAISNSST